MGKSAKSPHYPGSIKYIPINIPNCSPDEMRDKANALPFLAYHVETLADERKICITKPGGKSPFGRMKVDDFMVWIYDERQRDRWRISHGEIYDDLQMKLHEAPRLASAFIDAMVKVCKGSEPSQLITRRFLRKYSGLPGLPPDLILKTYKWIWVQEDCNYPTGEGRWMSMKGILKLRDRMCKR